jgi:hypothetical protein
MTQPEPAQEILPGLSDQQMEAVLRAAEPLDPGKRGVLLTRLIANLRDAPPDLPDIEFEYILQRSMKGLAQRQRDKSTGEVGQET